MELYAILIYDNNSNLKFQIFDLSKYNFIIKNIIKYEIIKYATEFIRESNFINKKYYTGSEIINNNIFKIMAYKTELELIIIISGGNYPDYILYNIIYNSKNISNQVDLELVFNKFKNPGEFDKILTIKSELDQTKNIIMESVRKLEIREEELNKLIADTQKLETESLKFKIKSQELNRCCIIL